MLKTTIAPQSTITAVALSNRVPATSTARHVPLKIAPVSASARRRLRPCSALASGSCAITSTTVLTKKMIPIPASLTEACSLT